MKHPMQPIIVDDHGIVRFQQNAIVRALLDQKGIIPLNLNDLAEMDFSQADWEQFYQLIGYSLSGFHELSLVSDAAASAVSAAAREIRPEFSGCRDQGCEIHCGVEEEAIP